METQKGLKVKAIRSDNGGEYSSNELARFCKEKGIEQQFTVPYNPQQNGVAERMNRTLVESARTMIQESGLPLNYWGEALMTAVYVRNICPTRALDKITPYEAWTGNRPKVDHLRVFGCTAYVYEPAELRRKLDMPGKKCTFIGYSSNRKAWRFLERKSNVVIESRSAEFNEQQFDGTRNQENAAETKVIPIEGIEDSGYNQNHIHNQIQVEENNESEYESLDEHSEEETSSQGEQVVQEELGETSIEEGSETVELRRSTRSRKPPWEFWKLANLAQEHEANAASTSEYPRTLTEELKGENGRDWKRAADEEMESLQKNQTWELVELPKGAKTIGCRWVLSTKHNSDGSLLKHKARLVAKGYAQRDGIDYTETYAPVARFNSIRVILAIAAERDMELHQMDVKTAFLYGELKETVYMDQPEGYIVKNPNLVCRLKKSLYGLKQSPKCSWIINVCNSLHKARYCSSSKSG